jgi:hypothetical protein
LVDGVNGVEPSLDLVGFGVVVVVLVRFAEGPEVSMEKVWFGLVSEWLSESVKEMWLIVVVIEGVPCGLVLREKLVVGWFQLLLSRSRALLLVVDAQEVEYAVFV